MSDALKFLDSFDVFRCDDFNDERGDIRGIFECLVENLKVFERPDVERRDIHRRKGELDRELFRFQVINLDFFESLGVVVGEGRRDELNRYGRSFDFLISISEFVRRLDPKR